MDINRLKETINRRISLELNDDFALEECWNIEADILSSDISQAIDFITTCSEEEFYWISEIFEDVISKTQSRELLQAMISRNDSLQNQEYKESVLTELKYAQENLID